MLDYVKYVFVLILFCANGSLSAAPLNPQDTIPPVFTIQPQDATVLCSANVENEFIMWLNNHAMAEADNGEADVINLLSNDEALLILQGIRSVACSGTGEIEMGFLAIDTCNNISLDTLYAIFSIVDNIPPAFNIPASDVSYDCHYGIQDSLQQWINNIGFAMAIDNCSDTIFRTNYSWEDNLGNTGFSDLSTPTNIVIVREICLWSVDVSFFIEDACGNINVSSATFSLSGDSHRPDLIFAPPDTVLQCSENIPDPLIIFIDGCDGELNVDLTESSTQISDNLDCAYYNYRITRNWNVSDVCGNENNYTQIIEVRDTTGPEAAYQGILALNCDSDLSELTEFISIIDNCGLDTLIFSDSIITSSKCRTQILRNYTARDICQNESNFQQTLQIEDFSAPEFLKPPKDTTVECSANVVEIFEKWIDSFGFAVVEDNCNMVYTRAVNPSVYTDTILINAAQIPVYNIPECPQPAVDNTLGFQIVEFVVYDICGNINIKRARFTVVDTLAPQIQTCPADLTVDLNSEQCDTSLLIRLPIIIDNCSPGKTENFRIQINTETPLIPLNDSLYLNLPAGENEVQYHYRDCGGNMDSCIQKLQILDLVPPLLTCPDDITLILEDQKCLTEHILNPLENFYENCGSHIDFRDQKPEGEALISYYLNNTTGKYSARNSILTFKDFELEGIIYNTQLILEYKLNLSPGSKIELRSETGDILHVIDSSICSDERVALPIDVHLFNFWLNDGRINFAIVHSAGSGEGTIPCNPNELEGQVVNDGNSYFRLFIEYSDIHPDVLLKNNETDEIIPINQGIVELMPGSFTAQYFELDAFGNSGTCFYNIEVIDEKRPQITCKDIVVEAPVQASPFYSLNTEILIQSVSDNCAIDTVLLSQDRYSCTNIGSSIELEVEAFDIYGNTNNCVSIVTIKGIPLSPAFLSNLCFADSLQLFANVDPAFVQSYLWTGPDNFRSQEANPLIVNINNSNSGVYFLAVTTRNGCSFFGSLDIAVDESFKPLITSDTTDYCLGENIFLNASIFNEQVSYLWYEGIAPGGVLIGETQVPVFSIQSTAGKHFYYVEVKSESCNSNPSSTISIDVLPRPIAEVDQAFITICEGDDIVLSTSIFSSIFNYEWTGPNGYFSRDRLPRIIEDTDFSDGGDYYLTIDNGICTSDPARVQVTIFEKPPRPVITGQRIFCEGQTAVLNVHNIPTGKRYHWFRDGQLYNSVSTNNLVISGISDIHVGDYTVVVDNGICFSDTSEIHTVFTESKLTIGADNDGPVCHGDQVALRCSYVPNASYVWEDPAGQIYTDREISVPAINGNYTVTVTTNNNCTAVTNTNVEVDIRPEITALSNSSLNCMSADMNITLVPTVFPNGNYGYEWTGPEMFNSNLESPVITALDSSVNGVYTLQVIKDNCASAPVTTEVEITIIPDIPEIQLSHRPCEGDTFELVIQNPVSGQVVEWLWTTPLGLVTTFEPFLKINGFNNNFAGNYTAIQSTNGCRSENSLPIFLEDAFIPDKPVLNGPEKVCESDKLVINSEIVTGAEYVWITPNGQVRTDTPILEIENVDSIHAGVYVMFIEFGSCRSPISEIINVEIIPKPRPPVFPVDTLAFCLSSVTSIDICLESSSVIGDEKYILINRQNGQVILEQVTPCFDLAFLNTGFKKEYRLAAVIGSNSCQSDLSNDFYLIFNEAPEVGVQTNSSSYIICGNTFETIEIINPQSYPVRYSSPDPELIFLNIEPNQVNVSNLSEGLNQMILSSSYEQCIDFYIDTIELTVIKKPEANDDVFSVFFNPVVILDIFQNDLIDYPLNPIEFSNLNHGSISFTNEQVQYSPVSGISENIEFDYTICYEFCEDECDTAHVEFVVKGNEKCLVGNVLTPNGDGYNDYFKVSCLDNNAYPDNSLSIYNQWGDAIFSASPYQNDWNGQYKGDVLPAGSYFYVLKLEDNKSILQGFIIIEL